MAGEWIKIRTNLPGDSRVGFIARECTVSENEALGGLIRLWAMADDQTTDGFFPGADAAWVDSKVNIEGFARALAAIKPRPWLRLQDTGCSIVGFDDHNGSSAKRRAADAARKRSQRPPSTDRPLPMRTTRGRDPDLEPEPSQPVKKGKSKASPHCDSVPNARANGLASEISAVGLAGLAGPEAHEADRRLLRAVDKCKTIGIRPCNLGKTAARLRLLPDPLGFVTSADKRADSDPEIRDRAGWVFKAIKREAEHLLAAAAYRTTTHPPSPAAGATT